MIHVEQVFVVQARFLAALGLRRFAPVETATEALVVSTELTGRGAVVAVVPIVVFVSLVGQPAA